jgi:hypothetical protein
LNHIVPPEINIENIVVTLTNIVPKDGGANLLNGYEATIEDILHASYDSDIDFYDDESEQETVINYNIHVENVGAN